PRVAASTCGSMALAYSAVQDPAALSSTQSPLAWPLSKIPAVTAPSLRAVAALRPRVAARTVGRDRTGCVAAGLCGYTTGQSAGGGAHQGPHRARSRPAPTTGKG